MKIAVINETSAADRNADIMAALEGRGHEILNVGMKKGGEQPELQYIQTGLLTGLLLHLKRVDLVVGGCGTGQGYLNSAMQYPGVFCGHILTALDAWLFAQINDGNCIVADAESGLRLGRRRQPADDLRRVLQRRTRPRLPRPPPGAAARITHGAVAGLGGNPPRLARDPRRAAG